MAPGNKGRTTEDFRREHERLEQALKTERAAGALERHGVPDHFSSLLAELPEDADVDEAARLIAQEIRSRLGSPAGSPEPLEQEGGDSPAGAVGGEASEEFPEPENFASLAAVTKSGPEAGDPPDPGPLNPKDRTAAAIAATKDWNELEALQAGMRRR